MTDSVLRIGMIGLGTVGGGVASMLEENASLYQRRVGKKLEIAKVLVRDRSKSRPGIACELLTDDPDAFFSSPMDLAIEVAGGVEPAGSFVRRLLEKGIPVVTANKALLAAEGESLYRLARENNAALAFEASCGGGIPIITALHFGLGSNQITDLYGILNGTCNYILSEMSNKGKDYKTALIEAQEAGFAEADPTMDVSGLDTAQKLMILAGLAFGVDCEESDVALEGIDDIKLMDLVFCREMGYEIKLLAIAQLIPDEKDGQPGRLRLRVHPSLVHAGDMIAKVEGSFNALSVFGDQLGHTLYYGRGAGRLPTASAVISDLLNVASGWYGQAFQGLFPPEPLATNVSEISESVVIQVPELDNNADDLSCRFYLRINVLDEPGVIARIADILGQKKISLSQVIQHDVQTDPLAQKENDRTYVPLAITTKLARQGDLFEALDTIESLPVVQEKPVYLRIVEFPEG